MLAIRSVSLPLLCVAAAATVVLAQDLPHVAGNATVVVNNPPAIFYRAIAPDTAFFTRAYPHGGNIHGDVLAAANPNGIGVWFKVQFSNFPKEGGPFAYHIHDQPVPADGNCTQTLGHLDPFLRGEEPRCNGDLPQTCQVGDLAGEHGIITSDPFESLYLDLFASTVDGLGSFLGNRSFTLHFANKTRITCGNFEHVASDGGASGLPPNLRFPPESCDVATTAPVPESTSQMEPTSPTSDAATGAGVNSEAHTGATWTDDATATATATEPTSTGTATTQTVKGTNTSASAAGVGAQAAEAARAISVVATVATLTLASLLQ